MDFMQPNPPERALKERSERLAFLSDAASGLLSAGNPDAFLDGIYDRLAALLGLEIYLHYSLSPDGAALHLRAASRGFGAPQTERLRRLSLDQGVCGLAARTRKPVVLADVQALRHPDTELIRSLGITAYACHPLIANGRLFGTLSFGSVQSKSFADESLALIRAVSDLVASAISRSQTEQALRENEARFRSLAEGMPHMVWETDANGANTYHSPLWYRYTGSDAESSRGANWLRFYHAEDRARLAGEWRESRRTEGRVVFDIEARIRRHDGAFRWFRVKGVPIRDDSGQVDKWVGTCTDIHALKQLEHERSRLLDAERAARAAAERASLMKDEFLSTVSHELRTPLNAMLGWAQILMHGKRDAETVREGLSIIERNAKAQGRLIADLLDMSRILSGTLQLEIDAVGLGEVVETVLESVRPAAKAKGVALRFNAPAGRTAVQGDPDRLQQVVWNLLSNAVKFTREGGSIEVSLERAAHQLELCVRDSGQGIPSELLPHVFDRFWQGDPSAGRRHGGLGLGLAIVRQLVEMHGGRIKVDSAGVGLGAAFTVCLPLAPDAKPRPGKLGAGERRPAELAGLTVLAVDDEPDSLSVVRRVLEDSSARVITASSAQEALEVLEREDPDVLVSDIAMPGVDGYELIRRLRASKQRRRSALPAAALTAYARPQDRARALEAGYHAHLSKPVQEAELVATVRALAEGPASASPSPA
jgi:PAS domain S-box-containing protein